jgi:phage tail-like protein
MSKWVGRGGGRKLSQPNVAGVGGVGAGGGRASAQPNVAGIGGAGAGGGRAGGQPNIGSPANWVGKGKGRVGSQPNVEAVGGVGHGQGRAENQPTVGAWNPKGIRSSQSTGAWLSAGGTKAGKVGNITDPEGNFIFALEIDGIEVAQFLECSGLKSTTEIFELQEGGMNHRVHKLPGQSRWENLQLRYGVTGDVSLLKWRSEILSDDFAAKKRRRGSIVVKNNQMEVVRRYTFVDAWPVSWEGPSLSASGAELAIEMIELAHNGISVG